ncbi:hypothetical protein QC762_0106230 [Podospora pseudocomata]|uniref:Uncharacterized protein n=1 Tax=Podospora pseudocomata TaxID=2093779 RepID=A0ABR0G2Y9_9PEZI|nr:hypothetical protein QC762_0106230 [Podospora pseudocomata]
MFSHGHGQRIEMIQIQDHRARRSPLPDSRMDAHCYIQDRNNGQGAAASTYRGIFNPSHHAPHLPSVASDFPSVKGLRNAGGHV